jgi:hypothetical protein
MFYGINVRRLLFSVSMAVSVALSVVGVTSATISLALVVVELLSVGGSFIGSGSQCDISNNFSDINGTWANVSKLNISLDVLDATVSICS